MRALRLILWPVYFARRYRLLVEFVRVVLFFAAVGKTVGHFREFQPYRGAAEATAVVRNNLYTMVNP